MVNKKYLLLAGFCAAMAAQPVTAQESESTGAQWSSRDMTYRGDSYDVLDSNYVPKSRMEQHRRYLNHQYAFPAKPRNMWELGVGGGLMNVRGDVASQLGGYGFHAHLRKAWGHTISTRLQYNYGIAKGLDNTFAGPTTVLGDHAWNGRANGYSYTQNGEYVVRNYRTELHQLNFDLIGSTNNINFYKSRIKTSFYGFVGLGVRAYKVRVNALNDGGSTYVPYDFLAAGDSLGFSYDNRKDFHNALKDNMDDTYETDARVGAASGRATILDDKLVGFAPSFGVGVAFRLGKRVNLAIENRYSFGLDDDLLDGHGQNNPISRSYDGLNYLSAGLNFNLGNASRSVEPLYWVNPLDHPYNELSDPRHMTLPDPILPDADGDGITDQFDKCPGTAAGIAVDAHGCPLDTDGDGVPDYKDKELITPTHCQPVDADGVGDCPCPDGCGSGVSACGSIGAGSISFDANSSRIRPSAQTQLTTLAAQMQANPTCKVVVTGAGAGSKIQQQRSWDRVNAIIEYMSETHSIDRNRFIFQYGQAGDASSVMYRSAMAGEEGPANVAPPFPNLRRN